MGITMELSVAGLSFAFRLNPSGSRYVAPIALAEWEPFRSKNTVPGRAVDLSIREDGGVI